MQVPWLFWFSLGDFLVNFVPGRKNREKIRRTQLYDFRKKFNSLKKAQPDLNWKRVKMVKGGQNIGFIVDNKYVFKVKRKYNDTVADERIMREKRITDAIARVLPVAVTKITPMQSDEYLYFRYDFIPGKNLIHYPIAEIKKHREKLGKQMAEVIYALYNADMPEINDLIVKKKGYGWTHGDFCSNVIVNPDTMDIVAVIDWEFAEWNDLQHEFAGINLFRHKMRESNVLLYAMSEYYKICAKKKKGKIV